ncbi:uncharacterized protein EAF01_011563 [Botrytis porri]|uniref:uncharacterized protein n=1 Tax=Botrytis porri TaxID=87229 RepID=UPI0019010210|nr:uncharacterized protein EAF01_011563 [Botrytis porri]KAF7884140.1 hypothetical protein EAF01_011563 [Botrytis porri]
MGHSYKRKPDCPSHQEFEDQRLLWLIFEFWECRRLSEEQLTWMIEPNFKPFGITSNRSRIQNAKSGFPQSFALERYLSDYDLSEHLAYLASRHAGGDAKSASNAAIGCLRFTSSEAALSLHFQQAAYSFGLGLNLGHTTHGCREVVDVQDVNTHLLLEGVRAFEPCRTTIVDNIKTSVLEESDGNGEHLGSQLF